MSLNELRRNDYSLDDDMIAVRDLFQDFFTTECPTSRVRAVEWGPIPPPPGADRPAIPGFDDALWKSLSTIGVASMDFPRRPAEMTRRWSP